MPVKSNVGAQRTTRQLPASGPAPGTEEEPLQGSVAGGGARSKADAFNDAAPESGFNIPAGQYIAHLTGAVKETEGEKESVKFSYEIAEGEHESKGLAAWYNLFDKDGKPMRGMGFFKRDVELLGQEEIPYEELDDRLEDLASERLLCNISVKHNGQFVNVYLQGLAQG